MPQTYFSIQAIQKMIYEVLSLFYENGGVQRMGVVGLRLFLKRGLYQLIPYRCFEYL